MSSDVRTVSSSSSSSDVASLPTDQRSAQPDDMVEATTSGEDGVESDSSVTSDSSEASDVATPSVPVLVSLESPMLAPIITCLNATARCASVFANGGVDIVPRLSYDQEWWRRATPSSLPAPVPSGSDGLEEAWRQHLALELQKLNAFLDGKMDRKIAATAGFEELLRMKIPRLRQRFIRINDIFLCLGMHQKVRDLVLNSAIVDGERISLLPVSVNPELDGSTLQQALDDMFWAQVLDDTDSVSPEDVPVLDKLGDVIVITCQSWNTHIDEQLWPERYTSKFLPDIQAKRKRRQLLKQELNAVQAELQKIASIDGANVPTSLEISSRAMKAAGLEEASSELRLALDHLEREISARCARTDELNKDLLEESRVFLDLDKSSMTPYDLKGVILFENEDDAATTITQSRSIPDKWVWQTQNRCYSVRLDQVILAAREADNFVVFYEKSLDTTAAAPIPIAPSVKSFCETDNNALHMATRAADAPVEHASYEPVSRESSADSGNPWITE